MTNETYKNRIRDRGRLLAKPFLRSLVTPQRHHLRQFAKRVIQHATARVCESIPLPFWPSILGRVHGIRIPRAIIPQKTCSAAGSTNINIVLALLDKALNVQGEVAECGVFRGDSVIPMALWLRQKRSLKKILAFDSFQGFGEVIRFDLDLGGQSFDDEKRVGGLSDTSVDLVQSKIDRFHLRNVELVVGYFKDSLLRFENVRFAFVHLDCDMYSSYKECMEFFYPRTNTNGIILLDEYNDPAWPGCNLAVDTFLSDKPEKLHPIVRDNFQKFYLVKDEAIKINRVA